jgi:putative ABC transport system permease protein
MSTLHRAWLSVLRKPVKNGILLLVVVLLTTLMASALAIKIAGDRTLLDLQRRIGVNVEIAPERFDVMIGEFSPYISYARLEPIIKDEHVISFDYSFGFLFSEEITQGHLLLMGTQNPDLAYFEINPTPGFSPVKQLVSGRMLTQSEIENGDYVVVLDQATAQRLNVTVGDEVRLGGTYANWQAPGLEPFASYFQLTVIGIYESTNQINEEYDWPMMGLQGITSNRLVDQEAIEWRKNMRKVGYNPSIRGYIRFPTLVLDDFDGVNALREKYAKTLQVPYKFTFLSEQVLAVLGPIGTLRQIADAVLAFTVGIAIAVFTLIILLFLKERRREIGIYFAIGHHRRSIVMQLWAEVAMIGAMAIGFAGIAGQWAATVFSNELIRLQLIMAQSQKDTLPVHLLAKLPSPAEIAELYAIRLDLAYLGLLALVMTVTLSFATILPIINILRQSPKDILQ